VEEDERTSAQAFGGRRLGKGKVPPTATTNYNFCAFLSFASVSVVFASLFLLWLWLNTSPHPAHLLPSPPFFLPSLYRKNQIMHIHILSSLHYLSFLLICISLYLNKPPADVPFDSSRFPLLGSLSLYVCGVGIGGAF